MSRNTGRTARRFTLGTLIVVALLAALTPTASARWIRGLSDINRYGDDIALCAEELTIGAEVEHLISSFESFYPTFNAVVGEPYPGLNPQTVDLYATSADAIAQANEILSFAVTVTYVETTSSSYRFVGETTLPTPAGYGDGDILYAYAFDFDILEAIAVPLTIGDAVYDCPTTVEPESIAFDVWTLWDLVLVDSPYPTILVFDAREADTSAVTVAVDDGPDTPVQYLGSIFGIGIALADLDAAGLVCDSSSLTLRTAKADGTPLVGETNINPIGVACS